MRSTPRSTVTGRTIMGRAGPALVMCAVLVFAAASGAQTQGVAKISVNASHGVAVLPDGRVMTWGENHAGQLGRGNTGPVNEHFPPALIEGIKNARDVAAGEDFTLLLMADGTVMSWGEADSGQLGLGTPGVRTPYGDVIERTLLPTRIPGLKEVRQIAAGQRNGFALLEDGTVMVWGSSREGLLADGKGTAQGQREDRLPFPMKIDGLSGVKSISAGTNIAFAVMADGTVRAWGSNQYGQMGVEAEGERWIARPTPIVGLTGVRSMHGGNDFAVAVLEDGSVRIWGRNQAGVFGDGSPSYSTWVRVPQPVPGVSGVVDLSTGWEFVLALLKDGTVRSWGRNNVGQLGVARLAAGKRIAQPDLRGVQGIATGGADSYFLMPEGQLLMAGIVKAGVTHATPTPFAVLR